MQEVSREGHPRNSFFAEKALGGFDEVCTRGICMFRDAIISNVQLFFVRRCDGFAARFEKL